MIFEVETWKDRMGTWNIEYDTPDEFCCDDLEDLFEWSEEKEVGFQISPPTEDPEDPDKESSVPEIIFRTEGNRDSAGYVLKSCPFCHEEIKVLDRRRLTL